MYTAPPFSVAVLSKKRERNIAEAESPVIDTAAVTALNPVAEEEILHG